MKRRGLIAAVSLSVLAALVAFLAWFFDAERRFEYGMTLATGLPCSVRKIWKHPRFTDALGVKVGPREAPHLELRAARIYGPSLARIDAVQVRPGDLRALRVPGLPEMTFDELNKFRLSVRGLDSLREKGTGDPLEVRVSGSCSELNALLERFGQVKFLRGEFEAETWPKRQKGRLDFPVRIELRGFLVRSLDGRFEFEAEEVTATIKIAGTLKAPKLDLGELEPYLGKKFVESFKEFKP